MSQIVKRYIPIVILASLAFFMVGDTLLVEPVYNDLATSGTAAVAIIGSFAIILSVVMLSRTHLIRIQKKKNIVESSVLLICMWATIIWGLFRFAIQGVSPTIESVIQNIFNGIVSPGDSTIYSLTAFFIASAAYRSFRTRSIEATILLAAGVIVMLGNAPIGEIIWSGFPSLKNWIMNVPNNAGARVIILSEIIAVIALYMRIILGYERGWMGHGD